MSGGARIGTLALAIALCSCSGGTPRPAATGTSKALVEAYVQAWNHHDGAAFDSLLSPGALHEDLAQGFAGHGAAEIKAFMAAIITQEPDFHWQLTNIVTAGPWVVAEWTWTATHTGDSPSGPVVRKRISGRGASVVELANGRIKRFTDYYDNASFFPRPQADSLKQ